MNQLTRLARFILCQIYLCELRAKSFITWFKSLFSEPQIWLDKPYQHEKILLIALYQKRALRPDLIRLLKCAKSKGYYVIAVNTLKLEHPAQYQDIFDLYIERFNFGRDFGSYQLGFLEIYKRKYQLSCPRLLMLNDSVFYESSRTPAFLEALMNSETEVLGATENHHLQYHLGSFCIAFSQSVLNSPLFLRFWQKYRKTDIRPAVIERGEKKLSWTVHTIVECRTRIKALYDVNYLSRILENDQKLLELAFALTCRSGAYPRLSPKVTWESFLEQHYYIQRLPKKMCWPLNEISATAQSLQSILSLNDPLLESKAELFIRSVVLDVFVFGSQIHTNATLLLHLGLPLIKLDGLLRGVFSYENILQMSQLINEPESSEMKALLFERQYGHKNLEGRNWYLFNRGYL